VARQAWQICRGTWRLNVGNGAVLWHRPDCPSKGIMTEPILTPGQRPRCGWALVPRGSRAHTGNDVVLLQTRATAETAANGVKLSAEASRVVTASHSHGIRVRYARNPPAEVDLARIRAERNASQSGPERISSQGRIKKPCRRRIRRSASPLFRGVTTPDLPEGI